MQLCVAKEGRWFSFSVPRSKESLVSQQAIPALAVAIGRSPTKSGFVLTTTPR